MLEINTIDLDISLIGIDKNMNIVYTYREPIKSHKLTVVKSVNDTIKYVNNLRDLKAVPKFR